MSRDKKAKKSEPSQTLTCALQDFLAEQSASTQEEICRILEKQGYEVNQSKVSRMLRKLGAVKIKNERGDVIYWLPKEPPPPELSKTVSSLVLEIVANETLIIVHASPGSASLLARVLDYRHRETEILGTVAGDDTIFIAPRSIKKMAKTLEEVKRLLLG